MSAPKPPPHSPSTGGLPQPAAGSPGDALPIEVARKVAKLARLELSEADLATYSRQLGAVLDHAASLRKLDLEGVEPLTSPAETVNRMDEDVVRPGLPTEALMKMAPEKDPPFVKVPKVIGEGA